MVIAYPQCIGGEGVEIFRLSAYILYGQPLSRFCQQKDALRYLKLKMKQFKAWMKSVCDYRRSR